MKKTYKIYRILNNNAVVSRDEKGQEIIIVGMGIGFHTRTGYYVEPEKVSSVYILQGKENCSRFRALINEIPFDCIEISGKIIDEAKKRLDKDLNDNLIIALADHVNFAVGQAKKGIRIPHLLSEEIGRFYKDEFQVGATAVDMLNKEYNITLPRSEAASIAFHLINAESGGNADETTSIIVGTEKILQIIGSSLKLKLQEGSLNYLRLVTHTKYFLKRVLAKEKKTELDLLKSIRMDELDDQYIKISACLDEIAGYLRSTYDYEISEDERFYMLIHILRVMQTD